MPLLRSSLDRVIAVYRGAMRREPPRNPGPERRFYRGPVRWLTVPTAADLNGFTLISWPELRAGWIARARATGMRRSSLESPVQPWLDWLGRLERLAITGVDLDGPEAAADLLGFVVEPATRSGVELAIAARQSLEDLDEAAFTEPEFGYPYSLQRLRWALRGERPLRRASARLPETGFAPDAAQAAAVGAGTGVVQVIAPAGSGKTAVLVERVRELRRRGTPAREIACLTFNRAAKAELIERLGPAGVGDVDAFTFHGLAYRIALDAGALSRQTKIGPPTLAQWRRLAALARERAGTEVWFEPAEAAEILAQVKLEFLLSAEQYAATVAASEDPNTQTMAALYTAHEEMQREGDSLDFDDLILRAVLALRDDEAVRERWQGRYHQILVDEYQDIEPAQELIVRILAAPQDQLFCAGDEDQMLYAFRRASVERIIRLDGLYPGLQRVAFTTNYRCAASLVEASRALIDANQVRFPKLVEPDPSRADRGTVNLYPYIRPAEVAAEVAALLQGRQPDEVAVLARTTNALRPLALACAELGVPIGGAERLFELSGGRLAIQCHLRLALHPEQASAELIQRVCQTPARGLGRGADRAIAARLRAGQSFEAAFASVAAPRRGRGALLAPGPLFTRLASALDAAAALAVLRGPGGFDEWFEQADQLAGLDQFESEVLRRAERDAAGLAPDVYLAGLEHQAEALHRVRQDGAIELLTIHAAKGRQWPHVILLACDEGVLPHARSAKPDPDEEARGEGIEAERRLAYVAFTRAGERLDLHYDRARPSRFLQEAGVIPSSTRPPPLPLQPLPPRRLAWLRKQWH